MNFAQLLFPHFSLILCGFLLCRYTPLNRTLWDQVDSLVYYFLFPVLLFQSIARSPLDLRATSSLIGAGVLTGAAAVALAYALPSLPFIGRHIDRRQHAGAQQVSYRFNSYMALALADRLVSACQTYTIVKRASQTRLTVAAIRLGGTARPTAVNKKML